MESIYTMGSVCGWTECSFCYPLLCCVNIRPCINKFGSFTLKGLLICRRISWRLHAQLLPEKPPINIIF